MFRRFSLFLQVRFIAVNDGYDSLASNVSQKELSMNIKNLVNEMYAKDISRKVAVSRRASQKSGDYVGVNALMGIRSFMRMVKRSSLSCRSRRRLYGSFFSLMQMERVCVRSAEICLNGKYTVGLN